MSFESQDHTNLVKLSRLSVDGVDAFVIDCNLAHGDDGVSLLADIRSGKTAADLAIPVIVTSGDDRRSTKAYDAGATQFLVKPYSPSTLSEELNRLLN